jgi:hypothetical protein
LKLLSIATTVLFLAAPVFAADAPKARVFFEEPKDHATVPATFKVKMGVEGMTVEPAGVVKEGTGHHHILIDNKSLKKSAVVPVGPKSIHYGKGQTETDLTLAPGAHTLTLQFADGNHQSYGPDMSSTIQVTVEAPAKK